MIDLKNPVVTIGTIDLFDFDPYHNRAGIGILIADTSYRRQGYAAEALDILIGYCFNMLTLNQLFCNISADNTASIGLFRNKGFEQSGEKKKWLKTPAGWESELFFQLFREK